MNTRIRWLLSILLLLCVCASGAAPTVNVLVDLKDARLQSSPSYTNRTVWIQAMSIPNVSSPSVVLGQPLVFTTDTNGQFWISNLVVNLYAVTVRAPPKQENFKFLVITNYPTEINAADYLVADSAATFPAGSVAWAAAVTDYRYGGTVPRPAPGDGWFLTISNGIAVWTRNSAQMTNFPSGQFIASMSGPGTNNDFRWILGAPTQWDRLYKQDANGVSFEYQSGAVQKFFHTHNNEWHFDSAPFLDYASDFGAPAIVDNQGKLQSLPTGFGVLTNDDNGNLGWYNGFSSQTNFVVTTGGVSTNQFLKDPTTVHVDQVADAWAFNGQEFWDTNYSSVVPVGRFLGGAVPSFTVNGIFQAEKPASSSSSPLQIDVGTPFSADMIIGRSNGLPRFRVGFDGGVNANGLIVGTNGFLWPGATASTLTKFNGIKQLESIPTGSGALTNDGTGVFGWYTGFQTGNYIAMLNGGGTNTVLLNPSLTNGINRGNAFSSLGSGSQSEQFGASASATGINSTAVGNQAQATATSATAVGASSLASATDSTAIGQLTTASASHSTAIGFGATASIANQIEMGTSGEWVDVPGALKSASITNGAATVSTAAAYDANKKLVSIANGTGWLHNNGSGTFAWSTPSSFDQITSGENNSAIMRVGTGASIYPTNGGNIFANYATNVPITGTVGGLNLSGTSTHTQFQQNQGYPTLDFNSAFNAGIGTLYGTGDLSIGGNWTNRSFSTAGIVENDTNGRFRTFSFLDPSLMGTNVILSAGTNIAISSSYSGGVTTWTIYGLAYDIRGLNNSFTGANQFSGSSTFTSAVQISANLTVSGNETVTGGFTNNSLTASTVTATDANKRLVSIANATGALTNNGSGLFGWYNAYATDDYVDNATNQLAIATTNRLNTLGVNATNNDLKIGQAATNWVNIQYTNAITYTSNYVFGATNVLDTQVSVNAKVTGAATNHVYVKTTDSRIIITTNTSSGPTLYTEILTPGITNFDNGFESTNTAVANSYSLLSKSNLVIKGVAPNVALGTDTNALLSLNGVDFMFRAQGTNAFSITNTGNGISIHGYWPLDLSFGNSFAGLISSGSVTNAAGSRVAYYSEVGNLALSTNVGESITAAQAANYAALTTDEIILMNGNLTVTLPTAIGIKGHSYLVKTVTSGTNAILTTGGQTIDGYAKYTNTAQFKYTRVTSDNANYWVTGQN